MLARVMAAFVLHGVEDVSCVDDETVLRLTKAIVTYRAAICGSNGAGVRGPYQLRPAPRVSRAWLPEHMRFGRWRSVPMPVAMPKMLAWRSEEHTSELQSLRHLVCRLLLEKK